VRTTGSDVSEGFDIGGGLSWCDLARIYLRDEGTLES